MVKKNIIENYMPDDEMTRFGFISHMEDYIKQLLKNPETAKVDDYLTGHGIDSPKALSILLKRVDPSDETSAVLIRTERIKPEVLPDGSKGTKDKFHIKYRLPRKDYMKKMRNLYITLFENYRANGTQLNEIDNQDLDSSVTKKQSSKDKITFSFGKNGLGLTDELTKVGKEVEDLSKDNNVYIEKVFVDSLDDVYDVTVRVLPKDKEKVNEEENVYERPLSSCANMLGLVTPGGKHANTLDKWCDGVNNNEKNHKPHIIDEEDGGAMGATSTFGDAGDNGSGQFVQPLGKPIKRKTIYITQEQYDHIKEAVEMDTAFGDFGYDSPGLKKKKDPAYNHKDMMKKSWGGNKDE